MKSLPLCLSCLGLAVLPAYGNPQAHRYTIRVLTVSAPEINAVRAAMLTAPGNDASLLKELLPERLNGGLISDITTRCDSGEWKIEALNPTPYPTQFSHEGADAILPHSFETRNTGITAGGHFAPPSDGKAGSLSLEWSRVRYAGRQSYPASTRDGTMLEQPDFLCDTLMASIPVSPGQWRLAGVIRPVELGEAAAAAPRTLLTFLQVNEVTPGSPPVALPENKRLHWVTFRLPAEEGLILTNRVAGDDAELLERLLQRAASGEIELAGHAACPLHPDHEAKPVKPSKDPFASEPDFTAAESIHEFTYPTSYDPSPASFSTHNAGHGLKLSARYGIEWEALDGPVEMEPLSPQAEAVAMIAPLFITGSLTLDGDLPAGAVRLAGAVLQPVKSGRQMMHLHFLKSAGPPISDPAGQRDWQETYAAVLSLPPALGSQLSATPVPSSATLEAAMSSADTRLLAWQCIAGKPGRKASVKRAPEMAYATKFETKPFSGDLLIPAGIQVRTCGSVLELHSGKDVPEADRFKLTLETPPFPTLAAAHASAKDGTPLPPHELAELIFPASERSFPRLTPGLWQLVSLALTKVPAGHPEHGRWHALILQRRSG